MKKSYKIPYKIPYKISLIRESSVKREEIEKKNP